MLLLILLKILRNDNKREVKFKILLSYFEKFKGKYEGNKIK